MEKYIACIKSSQNNRAADFFNQLKLNALFKDILFIEQISDIKNLNHHIKILIVLGGDGFTLRILHALFHFHRSEIKVYGINCGHLGFLMNDYNNVNDDCIKNIIADVKNARDVILNPLSIVITTKDDTEHNLIAINEISLLRQTYKTIHISVLINGIVRIQKLMGDGILLSTSAGSAAYNFSAGGPILPINSKLVSLTAINSFRPRSWKNAIIKDDSVVEFEISDFLNRPALACADFGQFYSVKKIKSFVNRGLNFTLLFNKNSHIEDKIINEQFSTT